MMKTYNIAPFGDIPPTDYPAWFEDDVMYFELEEFLANLPYYNRDIDKYIKKATK